MPPDEPLPEAARERLLQWVAEGAPWPASESAPNAEQRQFFEERIRPVLAERCFGCHGPELEEVESEFRMAGRAGLLRGGLHGPAVVPGEPEQSRLVQAIRYEDRHLRMPPEGALPEAERDDLERWVAEGAYWPDYAGPDAEEDAHGLDPESARSRWPFTPLRRPEMPATAEHPVDAFVLERLRSEGLEQAPLASEAELVRRAYYDLLGLPPSHAEVQAYLNSERPDRWELLIDALLARPEYGERWARRWLDVVRYAQTDGFERDAERPLAWQYRDWVVQAFNADLPYDRFLSLQLAGDELEPRNAEALIATGFYRLGPWDQEPDDPQQAEFDELDDVVRVIGEGMLGLTLSCARCHDHAFDPIGQDDYYAFLANLRGLRRYEQPQFGLESPVLRPLSTDALAIERWNQAREEEKRQSEARSSELIEASRRRILRARFGGRPNLLAALLKPEAERTQREQQLLRATRPRLPSEDQVLQKLTPVERRELRLLGVRAQTLDQNFQGELPWALSVREELPVPPTHILVRGRVSSPGREIEPGFPRVLCADDAAARSRPPALRPEPQSSGRRAELARWITSPENPLSWRVIANRIWQHLFSEGLVRTPNDFGAQGAAPVHPELLDWLAAELIESGGSLKAVQRLLLTSRTYRLSSRHLDPLAAQRDPDNQSWWRQNARRLSAEELRDSMLLRSGELSAGSPGRGYFPPIGREVLASMSQPGRGWEPAEQDSPQPRSLYVYAKRQVGPALLELFDRASPSLPVGRRNTTTTPTQALTLLHGEFANRRARALAEAVLGEGAADERTRARRMWESVLGRSPSAPELEAALAYLLQARDDLRGATLEHPIELAVPERIDQEYFESLPSAAVVHVPGGDWIPLRGRWGAPYNNTVGMDPVHGAGALKAASTAGDAQLRAELYLRAGCERFGLSLRARNSNETLLGLEVVLLPEEGAVELHRHGTQTSTLLARTAAAVQPERWHALEVSLALERLQVSLDGEPLRAFSQTMSGLLEEGGVGLRANGEGARLRSLELVRGGSAQSLLSDESDPESLALESLALLLFNLNEFVYVD